MHSKIEDINNFKKSNSSNAKIFLSVFLSLFFKLKAELQVLKFEFCQVKLKLNNG